MPPPINSFPSLEEGDTVREKEEGDVEAHLLD
jgi:hypothetical protein